MAWKYTEIWEEYTTNLNGDVKDLEETASVGRGSPVQQELEDSETEASKYIIHIV